MAGRYPLMALWINRLSTGSVSFEELYGVSDRDGWSVCGNVIWLTRWSAGGRSGG